MVTTKQNLENKFRKLAEAKPSPLEPRKITKIAIVSTPRCGSSYFCEMLRQTGACGWPSEWFNMRYLQAYGRVMGRSQVNFDQYFQWVVERTTTPNQVFSVNFHVEQYQHLIKQDLDVLKLGFDHIVYLHRRDKLAQAYSLRRAQITDQWSADTDPVSEIDEKQLTRSEIIKALYQIAQQEDFLQQHLRDRIKQEFCYEEFTGGAARGEFERFLEVTGLADAASNLAISTRMKIQRKGYAAEPLRKVVDYICPFG